MVSNAADYFLDYIYLDRGVTKEIFIQEHSIESEQAFFGLGFSSEETNFFKIRDGK